jgi:hypothetical protein
MVLLEVELLDQLELELLEQLELVLLELELALF